MRITLGLAILAAGLTSCATLHEDRPIRGQRIHPNFPTVYVADNTVIVVDQEPIFMPKNFKDKDIEWQLPHDSLYRFTDDGVKVAGEKTTGHVAFTNCRKQENGLRFRCKNDGTPGEYKYTIRVTGPAEIPPLDPWIRNS